MNNENLSKKLELCTIWVQENMLAAEKEAQTLFEAYPDFINKELKYTVGEPIDRLKEIYQKETLQYDRQLDIEESKAAEEKLIKFFVGNKEIYDDNLSINNHGTLGQFERMVGQFFTLMKIQHIQEKIHELEVKLDQSRMDTNLGDYPKIKWNRNAAEFGYMMILLAKKGYIELPAGHGSESAYSRLAEILFRTFDVTDSYQYFKNALNPGKNALCDTKREKLNLFPDDLPESEELGSLKKSKPRSESTV